MTGQRLQLDIHCGVLHLAHYSALAQPALFLFIQRRSCVVWRPELLV